MAPARLMRFQNRENRTSGPKVAPKPAHAKETMVKITLFSSSAMMTATSVMTSSAIRDMVMTCLSEASFLNRPWKIFLEKAEAAIRR